MIVGSAGAYFTHTISLFLIYVQLIWWLPRLKQRQDCFAVGLWLSWRQRRR